METEPLTDRMSIVDHWRRMDDGSYYCSVHVKLRHGGKLQPGPAIIACWHKAGDAGTLVRSMRVRHVDHSFVLARLADRAEAELRQHPYKIRWYPHYTTASFIAEQESCAVDAAWMREVRSLCRALNRAKWRKDFGPMPKRPVGRHGQVMLFNPFM